MEKVLTFSLSWRDGRDDSSASCSREGRPRPWAIRDASSSEKEQAAEAAAAEQKKAKKP